MSEKEKNALEKLSQNISKMPDSKKEYLLGLADGIALMSDPDKKEDKDGSTQEATKDI